MAIENYYIYCVRKRKTETLNGNNRAIATYTDTPISGYKSGSSSKITIVAGKETIEDVYKFYTDDFDLQSQDIIVYDGESYLVTSDPKNTANRNHHIKVMLRKIKNVTV